LVLRNFRGKVCPHLPFGSSYGQPIFATQLWEVVLKHPKTTSLVLIYTKLILVFILPRISLFFGGETSPDSEIIIGFAIRP
jgi:hypothetical protein